MKKCELCGSPAKMFCESDQASLCWDCDTKVHGANFLVAKHSRTLLCHVCQSLTPWNGSGPKLGPTISVCNVCVGDGSGSTSREETNRGETYTDDDYDDANEEEDDDDDGGDEDEDDDEENQVVPWSSTPPPQVSSSSTSDQEFATGLSSRVLIIFSTKQESILLKYIYVYLSLL
ncbi:zinc finger protein CONSTANS-LIKE 4 isoform X4 [Citrus clementina]|uniref:zinc finger protein CONSTANS-LIKE 4 isoform X4 n=1 Tax=Citrus clementina TaxID=85681 RepID=UPI000CED1D3D|nr:zinc finger protein CONSTANS-LIKE 4 isoform X4 [Citrus x clementina]